MIKHERCNVIELPLGTTMRVGNEWGKINDDGLLELWRVSKDDDNQLFFSWKCTNKTLEEYNIFYTKDPSEMTINDVAKIEVNDWCKNGKKLYLYRIIHDWYFLSYNKPVLKHNLEVRSGERVHISDIKYPIIKELLSDNWYYEFEYSED